MPYSLRTRKADLPQPKANYAGRRRKSPLAANTQMHVQEQQKQQEEDDDHGNERAHEPHEQEQALRDGGKEASAVENSPRNIAAGISRIGGKRSSKRIRTAEVLSTQVEIQEKEKEKQQSNQPPQDQQQPRQTNRRTAKNMRAVAQQRPKPQRQPKQHQPKQQPKQQQQQQQQPEQRSLLESPLPVPRALVPGAPAPVTAAQLKSLKVSIDEGVIEHGGEITVTVYLGEEEQQNRTRFISCPAPTRSAGESSCFYKSNGLGKKYMMLSLCKRDRSIPPTVHAHVKFCTSCGTGRSDNDWSVLQSLNYRCVTEPSGELSFPLRIHETCAHVSQHNDCKFYVRAMLVEIVGQSQTMSVLANGNSQFFSVQLKEDTELLEETTARKTSLSTQRGNSPSRSPWRAGRRPSVQDPNVPAAVQVNLGKKSMPRGSHGKNGSGLLSGAPDNSKHSAVPLPESTPLLDNLERERMARQIAQLEETVRGLQQYHSDLQLRNARLESKIYDLEGKIVPGIPMVEGPSQSMIDAVPPFQDIYASMRFQTAAEQADDDGMHLTHSQELTLMNDASLMGDLPDSLFASQELYSTGRS